MAGKKVSQMLELQRNKDMMVKWALKPSSIAVLRWRPWIVWGSRRRVDCEVKTLAKGAGSDGFSEQDADDPRSEQAWEWTDKWRDVESVASMFSLEHSVLWCPQISQSHFQEQIYDTRGLLKDQTKADLTFMLRSEPKIKQNVFVIVCIVFWGHEHNDSHVQIVLSHSAGATLRNIMEFQHISTLLYSTQALLQQPEPNARSSTVIYWCLFEHTCLPSFQICLPQINMFGCLWCLPFVKSNLITGIASMALGSNFKHEQGHGESWCILARGREVAVYEGESGSDSPPKSWLEFEGKKRRQLNCCCCCWLMCDVWYFTYFCNLIYIYIYIRLSYIFIVLSLYTLNLLHDGFSSFGPCKSNMGTSSYQDYRELWWIEQIDGPNFSGIQLQHPYPTRHGFRGHVGGGALADFAL